MTNKQRLEKELTEINRKQDRLNELRNQINIARVEFQDLGDANEMIEYLERAKIELNFILHQYNNKEIIKDGEIESLARKGVPMK